MQKKKAEYKEYLKKKKAFEHAMGVLQYDMETSMPKGGADDFSATLGVLSEECYKMETSPDLRNLLNDLYENREKLDFITRREVEEHKEEISRIECIPINEFVDYQMLIGKASSVWQSAKQNNDYELFKPYLKQIVSYNRKFALYYKPDKNPYDTLLDQYEKGLDCKTLDIFFDKLSNAFKPLVEKVSEMRDSIDDSFLHKHYPRELQDKISREAMSLMGIDGNYCTLGEVEHPFTTNFSKHDVRITTHYYEDALESSFYSVIHEGGHALYELHTGDDLIGSPLATGTSMGIHESQSRLFENIIGRSESFINVIFPKIKEVFPDQLKGVSPHDFYRAVNKSIPSLIRTEADELTYCFHVMIRYRLEKELINGTLTVDDLPAKWNSLYKEYLGVDVPDDKHGVLQDSHWSGGSIGYFPSYAIGSAYASQIMDSMKKEIDVESVIAAGNMKSITDWLTDKIWKYGKTLDPAMIIRNACGSDFNPQFYIDYITSKIRSVYGF